MRRRTALSVLLTGLLATSGCAFNRLKADTAAMRDRGRLSGEVEVEGFSGAPVVVAAGRIPEGDETVMAVFGAHVLREPDAFSIFVPPGKYVVGAYEDKNGDNRWSEDERGAVSKEIVVIEGEKIDRIRLRIDSEFGRPRDLDKYKPLEAYKFARGDVLALDDKRFSEEPAKRGMWEPLKAAQNDRPGIYMLQEYDPTKTPVLFIHGMVGYPQQFGALIEGLDKSRFQPWVLFYPSGYELEGIGKFVHVLVNELEAKHDPERTCLVAHSMGGLVARKFLDTHVEKTPNHSVRGLVTLASPLGGMPSAGMGVKMAPAVVPAWYDIAPGSEFLEGLYDPPLPRTIEYHLLFAFDEKGADDGTVPIPRQLRAEAQAEASVVRGYSATHVGILKSKAAAAQVYRALDRCRGDRPDEDRVAKRPKETGVVK